MEGVTGVIGKFVFHSPRSGMKLETIQSKRLIGELLSKRLVLRDLIEDASTVSSKQGEANG